MSYEAWRISFQSSEQAARWAYGSILALQSRIDELERDAARYRVARARIIPENLYFDLPPDDSVGDEEISRTVDAAIDEYLSREA